MTSLIADLYAVVSDEIDMTEIHRETRRAEPYYTMLCGALGKEKANKAWDAAIGVGSAEVCPAFLAGLRLGIRIMAGAL